MNLQTNYLVTCVRLLGVRTAALLVGVFAYSSVLAQSSTHAQRLSTERNSASQRYEINQTFDGQAFFKDNNTWVYTKEFSDLFGMPGEFIDDVRGIEAAAFRIEDSSYQECGFGGQPNACRRVEQCLVDMYFDESKTPLPWASRTQSEWLPWYSSMRWLRPLNKSEKPYGMTAPNAPSGVLRNETLNSPIVAFADPVSKRQAIFTSNRGDSTADEEGVSGSMTVVGYTRAFYKSLSIVSVQFGCATSARKRINIRLDAKKSGAYEVPVARFNRIVLPEDFVRRINDVQKIQSDKNATFYQNVLRPPAQTGGATSGMPPAPTK
jgi:hypothetical protein